MSSLALAACALLTVNKGCRMGCSCSFFPGVHQLVCTHCQGRSWGPLRAEAQLADEGLPGTRASVRTVFLSLHACTRARTHAQAGPMDVSSPGVCSPFCELGCSRNSAGCSACDTCTLLPDLAWKQCDALRPDLHADADAEPEAEAEAEEDEDEEMGEPSAAPAASPQSFADQLQVCCKAHSCCNAHVCVHGCWPALCVVPALTCAGAA